MLRPPAVSESADHPPEWPRGSREYASEKGMQI